MSSLSNPPFDPATAAAAQPAGNTPPELELGGVAFVIDQDGLIVAAEPICSALFQWEPAEVVGQPLETLLLAGTDKIREHLVPTPGAPGPDLEAQARLFALAQRRDGTSFPVAVTLELLPPAAGCWWAVAFHDVSSPPAAPPESRVVGLVPPPASTRRDRVQVSAPLTLETIPDIFQRAPAEPPPQPEPAAPAAPPMPEPSAQPARMALSPVPPAPASPPAPPAPANADTRLHELEQRLNQSAADLKRTRAHLHQQDEQLHAAHSAAQQAATALEEQTTRCTQMEEQLTQALQVGDDLNNRLAAEQQARAESEARLQELEQRLAQTTEEFQRLQAQSPPPAAPAPAAAEPDPELHEQLLELETRLRTAVTSLARATAELETERGERRRSEQRAATLSARMQQLHEELKTHLESEQLDHQRLTQLELQLHEQAQQHELAVAKLQSSLQLEQCERTRLETELLRSRLQPTGSARALANGLRRKLQPPVETLHRTARRLLQLQLSEEQKQLAQTLLENTLLLQTSLHESPEV